MIIYLLLEVFISFISVVLSPFTAVTFIFSNVFIDNKFIDLMRLLGNFISPLNLVFILSSIAFWLELFVIKPVVDIIRKKILN